MTAPPRDTRSVGRRCQCASFRTLTMKAMPVPVSRFTGINLSRHGMLQGSVAGGSESGNARRACCPAPKSGDREEEGGLRSLT
jgi:hypothetical protein